MYISEHIAREQIVEVCRRMHERGLISGTEGNVSIRLEKSRILVTPSGVNKGFIKESDLVIIDEKGKEQRGGRKASSEVKVHLSAYRVRPDIASVVHAHPPTAVAFTIAGISLAQCILPESILVLGQTPTAPYAPPSSDELAQEMEKFFIQYDIVMMDRHGSVTLGRDVFQAYDRLESLEHTAVITLRARLLGPVRPLPEKEVRRLHQIAEALGIKSKFQSCENCNVCDK